MSKIVDTVLIFIYLAKKVPCSTMLKVEAFQIAEDVSIKLFRSEFTGNPLFATNYELFYESDAGKYAYVLNYGVVVFANYTEVEKSDFIRFLKNYTERPVQGDFKEDLLVNINPERKLTFSYTSLEVPALNENVVRIIMLNTAQSVVMEMYESLADHILDGTKRFAADLETAGKMRISPKNLLRFIGRTINVKNSIIDNLYIFGSPDVVWDDEYLSKLDRGLREMFDINTRFRALDYQLRVIQDNLELFTELLQNRESTRLEWIVIALIFIEVMNLFFGKLFGSAH